MVPVDAFEPRISDSWYKRLLQSAVASNFNMLRLWSSGNYYREAFYDMADECEHIVCLSSVQSLNGVVGILLWSEFQFSDNFYPGEEPS